MNRATRNLLWVNAGWMAFVWITRIKNAVGASGSQTLAYVLSAVCLAGAAALAVVAWRKTAQRLIAPIALGHIAIWLVRGTQIGLSNRSAGFKSVHIVIGIISIGLALWLMAAAARQQFSAPTATPIVEHAG